MNQSPSPCSQSTCFTVLCLSVLSLLTTHTGNGLRQLAIFQSLGMIIQFHPYIAVSACISVNKNAHIEPTQRPRNRKHSPIPVDFPTYPLNTQICTIALTSSHTLNQVVESANPLSTTCTRHLLFTRRSSDQPFYDLTETTVDARIVHLPSEKPVGSPTATPGAERGPNICLSGVASISNSTALHLLKNRRLPATEGRGLGIG